MTPVAPATNTFKPSSFSTLVPETI
jgi:hypothetical protein